MTYLPDRGENEPREVDKRQNWWLKLLTLVVVLDTVWILTRVF